ncbi:MAG TPA: TolC family protein [Thermoanaerobaculia bacterium]
MTSTKHRERRARLQGAGAIALSLSIFVPIVVRAEEPAQPPTQTPTLTLQQALRRALEANASAATGRSQIAASQAQVRQIRAGILPHLDLDTAATRNSNEVAFDVNGFRAVILPRNDWSARINLSQPIYAGRRETMALNQGRLGIASGEAVLRSTEDMVLLATASDYLGIVQGESLIGVEQKNLELAQRRKSQAQAFFEAGEQTRVNVLRAETDQKAAERALAAASQSRDLAASRLRLDLGLDEPVGASLRVAAPELKFPPLPAAEALVATAEVSYPAI